MHSHAVLDVYYAFIYMKQEARDVGNLNFLFLYNAEFDERKVIDNSYLQTSLSIPIQHLSSVSSFKLSCQTIGENYGTRTIGCMIYNDYNTILFISVEFYFSDSKVTHKLKDKLFMVPVDYQVLQLQFTTSKMVLLARNMSSDEQSPHSYNIFVYEVNKSRKDFNFPMYSLNAVDFFNQTECFNPKLEIALTDDSLIVATGNSNKECQEPLYNVTILGDFYLKTDCDTVMCLENYSLVLNKEEDKAKNLASLVPLTNYISAKKAKREVMNPFILGLTTLVLMGIILRTKMVYDSRQRYLQKIMSLGPESDESAIDQQALSVFDNESQLDIAANTTEVLSPDFADN